MPSHLFSRRPSARRTVRLCLELLEDRTLPSTFTVLNTDDSGPGSLRQAILDANSNPGANEIDFHIGSGAQTIAPQSALPAISNTVLIDGWTQPGWSGKPLIELDGENAGASAEGLQLQAAHCTIRGLVMDRFGGNGIDITGSAATGNVIEGNYIGTDITGTAALGNGGNGVMLSNAAGNTIGGTAAGAGNVISGNAAVGVKMSGSGTTGNVVAGNYIGTDLTGTVEVHNGSSGADGGNDGVLIAGGAAGNTVGGLSAAARNAISGNADSGVELTDSGTRGNLVAGNYIGTDSTGTAGLGNLAGAGVYIHGGASSNTVGGTAAGARNVISGNAYEGVGLQGSVTSANVIAGNYIGTDASGTRPIPNDQRGAGEGAGAVIVLHGATGNTIGGTAAGSGNVIAGNYLAGVNIRDAGTTGNVVAGNLIGTDFTGATGLANTGDGILIDRGAAANTVGGAVTAARNVISGNTGDGITIRDGGTTGNVVQGNYIGTDATGTAARPNSNDGVLVTLGASGNIIGDLTGGTRNVISGNFNNGVEISGSGTAYNQVVGNIIGLDASGSNAVGSSIIDRLSDHRGNLGAGVFIAAGAAHNTIGGLTGAPGTALGNVISGNYEENDAFPHFWSGYGVWITDSLTSDNALEGNIIGLDATGTKGVGTDGVPLGNGIGVGVEYSATNTTIGGTIAGVRNVISNNAYDGIQIYSSSNNLVAGNFIGTDITGMLAIGNPHAGVEVQTDDADNNTIGGTVPGARNVISGNPVGLLISGTDNLIEGNYIGTDATGDGAFLNDSAGVAVVGNHNTIGGTTPGAGNVLLSIGIGGNDNLVQGNLLGVGAHGRPIPNSAGGITIQEGSNNIIGGLTSRAGNVISSNTHRASNFTAAIYIAAGNFPGSGNSVLGNVITDNATSGVLIDEACTGNTVVGNIIARNTGAGVEVFDAGTTGNRISGNSIYGNGGLGIDLGGSGPFTGDGVTLNGSHTGAGPNNWQFFPTLTSVQSGSTSTTIQGTFNDANEPGQTITLEFFANASPAHLYTDGRYYGEGQTYLGSAIVITDANGNASFNISFAIGNLAGQWISATALGPDGSTSEFSADVQATIPPTASLSGIVWKDFNNDGQVDFGEKDISGVPITLSGTDDLGNAVNLPPQMTDSDGAYIFPNLRPGNYCITETQPAGYLQGIDTIGSAGGVLVPPDQFCVSLPAGVNGLNYNFGERPPAGGPVQHGQTATIGFWNNKNGQALIKALNGGAGSQLADWLAATLPHTFGIYAGGNNLTGKDNASVASLFQSDFLVKAVKLDAQVLATALNVYATNAALDSTGVAAQYGFTVSGDGVGTATVSVGSAGDAFGVANNTTMTVIDLLLAADAQAVNGVLYNGDVTRRKEANDVFSALNQAGDVG